MGFHDHFESTHPILLRDLAPKFIDLAKKVSGKRGRIGKGMDDGCYFLCVCQSLSYVRICCYVRFIYTWVICI